MYYLRREISEPGCTALFTVKVIAAIALARRAKLIAPLRESAIAELV
jgi:hypothetical protein